MQSYGAMKQKFQMAQRAFQNVDEVVHAPDDWIRWEQMRIKNGEQASTEKDWSRREQKRHKGWIAGLCWPETVFLEGLRQRGVSVMIPRMKYAPDDRNASKRQWETAMQKWRSEMEVVAAQYGFQKPLSI